MSGKRKDVTVRFVLLLTLILGMAPALYAQAVSIATVTGRVTDEQGALVTGAQIKINGVDTGAISTAVTNQDGIYTIPNLPIGAYTLQTSFPGFQTYVQTGILLRVNDHVQINVIMRVGAVAETVEVKANAGLVQTQQNGSCESDSDGWTLASVHCFRGWNAQQAQRIAKIDFLFVLVGQPQILDRADAFADEHRPAFRVEGAVTREYDPVGAEKIQSAAQRRG